MPETTYIFNTQNGATPEAYEVKFEYGADFGAGGSEHDIKITVTQTAGTNQGGTEDTIGIAFDLNSFPVGLTITDVTVLTGNSTFVPTSGIDENQVADSGYNTPTGFNTTGGNSGEPYDAFVKVSDQGSGEGIVSSFSFVLTGTTDLDFNTLLANTDWWIRTLSTESGGSASTIGMICFAPGTLVATPGGEAAVETLRIGDPVLTADGRSVPVKWIGRQTVMKSFGVAERMEPVRIKAGALGGGLPHADLTVTADHGMIIRDEVAMRDLVINASALVNGGSIDWVPHRELPGRVTFYHVETEDHDVILANGAPTETFLDIPNRKPFDNYQEYLDLYGAERPIAEMDRPRITCQRLLPGSIKARLGIVDQPVDFDLPLSA